MRDRSWREAIATTSDANRITLRIEGSRAVDGVSLSDFEGFIDHFLRALREFDRSVRDERVRKPGRPERRAELVTALRLVRFEPGSGIATVEPIVDDESDDGQLFEDVPLPLHNLRSLMTAIEERRDLAADVVKALDRARRAAGDDGSIGVELPSGEGARQTLIDQRVLAEIPTESEPEAVEEAITLSGRLHLVDLEPDRIAIRTSDGVEWDCRYPPALEDEIRRLIGEVVWASGLGRLVTPQRGRLDIDRIEGASFGEQSLLFTTEPVPIGALLQRSRISGPQGLDAVSDPEWTGDEADEAYVAALLGDDER